MCSIFVANTTGQECAGRVLFVRDQYCIAIPQITLDPYQLAVGAVGFTGSWVIPYSPFQVWKH